jgi:hypothetical protein
MAVTMKNAIFYTMLCIAFLCSVRRLLVVANNVPSSPILVTLMMEELCSSETSDLTRAIQQDGILQKQVQFSKRRVLVIKSWMRGKVQNPSNS